jgi:hypothetical protein
MRFVPQNSENRGELRMFRRNATVAMLFVFFITPISAFAQQPTPSPTVAAPAATPAKDANDPIERIKDEGMNHSQVIQTLSYLSEAIE